MIPFSVHVEGAPEGNVTIVLGASYPYLLVAPAPGESAVRWVEATRCRFGRVYFDQPWHAPFTSRAPDHDHDGIPA